MVHSDNEVSVLRNGGSGAPGITLGSNGGAGGGLEKSNQAKIFYVNYLYGLHVDLSGGTGGLGGSGESSEDEREGRIRVGRDYQAIIQLGNYRAIVQLAIIRQLSREAIIRQ